MKNAELSLTSSELEYILYRMDLITKPPEPYNAIALSTHNKLKTAYVNQAKTTADSPDKKRIDQIWDAIRNCQG